MTRSFDEREAWSAARDGDSRAFTSVFDLHYDRVFRHVVGLTAQHADADEVCGAAFLELWRHRNGVRVVRGSVLAWLLVTATNLTRNHGRKTHRYRALLHSLPRDHQANDAAAIVQEQDDLRLRADAVTRELDRLRPLDAQLVQLTSRGELSVQDAAEALGISAGAARVRLHRVRARLRDRLGSELQLFDLSEER